MSDRLRGASEPDEGAFSVLLGSPGEDGGAPRAGDELGASTSARAVSGTCSGVAGDRSGEDVPAVGRV